MPLGRRAMHKDLVRAAVVLVALTDAAWAQAPAGAPFRGGEAGL